MGKTAKRVFGVIGAIVLVATFGGVGLALAAGMPGFAAAIAVVQTLAFHAVAINFVPEIDDFDGVRQLAENLTVQAGATEVRGVPFGHLGIAGQILFRKNIPGTGNAPDELLLILKLAGYPCTSLEKFWMNGTLVFDGESTTGPGAITTGTFANELWVWFRTGTETTQAFPEIAALSSEWNAKTRELRGIPAVAIRLKVTEKLDGRLEPLAQIKGAKLYDPRLDSTVPGGSGSHDWDDPTTWAWSENPKLAELLYLRGASVNNVRIFGMGVPKAQIDLENFASEANICEEQVDVVAGGTIDRYSCNGLLVPSRDHRGNLRLLLSASAGTMDASGGVYRTFAGAWRAPVMTLTEADIDGAPTDVQLQKDPSDEINIISGSFADPNSAWQVKEYPEIRDQDSIDLVGENPVSLDLPFTVDHRMAQRIAKIELKRLNAGRTFGANYWLRTLALQPGDIVTQTYARYSVSSETYRVNVWGLEATDDDRGQRRLVIPMQLVEEHEDWYDWDEDTEEQQTVTVTPLPSVNRLPNIAPNLVGSSLINAGFESGTLRGWTPAAGSGTWSVSSAEPRFGTYHLNLASTTGASVRIRNNSRLQVAEGDRVLAMGFVQRTGSGSAVVRVLIVWRDVAGTNIATSFGNSVSSTDYERSRVVAIAPADAVIADFEFQFAWVSGGAQGMLADGAYMAIVPRDADIETIITDQIADEAATEILASNPANGSASYPGGISTGSFFVSSRDVATLSWTNPLSEAVDISIDYKGLFSIASAEPSGISRYAALVVTGDVSYSEQTQNYRFSTSVDPDVRNRAGSHVLTVPAGDSVTARVRIYITAQAGTYPSVPNENWYDVSLSIKALKR